ncbi:unnamed protein product [Coregonus sp. 'balchen']|nr:unnamed protein product [Coregonus sp. 'balchen']
MRGEGEEERGRGRPHMSQNTVTSPLSLIAMGTAGWSSQGSGMMVHHTSQPQLWVSQCGKSFIKDALKCMAHGLRHKFSCISRKCLAIKEMVFQLQRECYLRHNLCSAAKENVAVMVEMIHFQDLFPKGPYVELVNILLSCGEEVKEALTRSVRLQCEQNWGALCDSLSVCSSLTPPPGQASPDHRRHGSPHSEPDHPRPPRQGDKSSKGGFNAHPRSRSQGPRRQSPEAGVVRPGEVEEEEEVEEDV